MARSRRKCKGRSDGGGFLAMPHAILNSAAFRGLSGSAVKLLLDLGAQFNGRNNGDLCAAWSSMRHRGWRSRDTLWRAQRELLDAGLIELTRQGGLHGPHLFAVTWLPIDECGGKLDVPATRVASGLWRRSQPPAGTVKNQSPNTESGQGSHEFRVRSGKEAA